MIGERDVLATLNEITDPCSTAIGARAGLVDMGLVRDLRITAVEGGASVSMTIGATDPGCLMINPVANEAQLRLEALPGVAEVWVTMDVTRDWVPADMTPEYRARLAALRARRRRDTGDRIGLAPDGQPYEPQRLSQRSKQGDLR
jgi:metal-sulfur cluster biosynthetic enzyme